MCSANKKLITFSFFIILCFVIFFCIKKQGMFTDEIYTFGLANSFYAPYITDVFGGNIIDQIVNSADLFNYIAVKDGEQFQFASVFYNQSHDTLPPLYYCIIHFVSSFFPNVFSKWFGLGVNIILYVCSLLALFKLCNKIFNNDRYSLIVILFYGLSSIGLSTMLMIRMYLLLTLFTILLAYFSLQMIENKDLKYCVVISLLHLFGMLTHYYYAVYGFFVLLIVAYYLTKNKQYKFFYKYLFFNMLGVFLFLASFPEFFNQFFAHKLVSGRTAYANFFLLSNYKNVIAYIIAYFIQTLPMQIFVCTLIAFISIKRKRVLIPNQIQCYFNIVIIPAFLSLFLISIISPIVADRYIYNLVPIFCLIIAKELLTVHLIDCKSFQVNYLMVSFVLSASIVVLSFSPPRFLYKEMPKINAMLKTYNNCPCVFFDNNYSSPITENLSQLMIFKNFIVVNNVDSKSMKNYVEGNSRNNEFVLFVDTNKFFSSGYDSKRILKEIQEKSDYKEHKYLYSNYSVDVYVLKKQL